ncbi:hypothetical protein Rhal01_03482 [Rubritalea halochordaticola]|uniref:DUF3347 domain-containing protein n=1 Tax=Rubritalea halochordaticola TaxID=714537 RepID=A0ABP9V5X9_9BACT
MKTLVVLFSSVSLLSALCMAKDSDDASPKQAAVEAPANNLTHLRAEILKMIALLEKGDLASSEAFIKKYAIPDELTKILSDEKLEELTERFHEEKREKLVDVLKSTADIEPKISEDKLDYRFLIPNKRGVTFRWDAKTSRFHVKN